MSSRTRGKSFHLLLFHLLAKVFTQCCGRVILQGFAPPMSIPYSLHHKAKIPTHSHNDPTVLSENITVSLHFSSFHSCGLRSDRLAMDRHRVARAGGTGGSHGACALASCTMSPARRPRQSVYRAYPSGAACVKSGIVVSMSNVEAALAGTTSPLGGCTQRE